jgi:hypothetical protein
MANQYLWKRKSPNDTGSAMSVFSGIRLSASLEMIRVPTAKNRKLFFELFHV